MNDLAPVLMAEHVATLDNLKAIINRQNEAMLAERKHVDDLLKDLWYMAEDGIRLSDNAENMLDRLVEVKRAVETEQQARAMKPKEGA